MAKISKARAAQAPAQEETITIPPHAKGRIEEAIGPLKVRGVIEFEFSVGEPEGYAYEDIIEAINQAETDIVNYGSVSRSRYWTVRE